jgi:hypothetical protein
MQILGLLGIYFDAVAVEVKKNLHLFRLALVIVLQLDFFDLVHFAAGLFWCGRFCCWTFLMWDIMLLYFLAPGLMNRQAFFILCQSILPSICTYLIFLNLYLTKLIFELDFVYLLCISHLIFTACVACKNQVPNWLKIKFKNQFREIEI